MRTWTLKLVFASIFAATLVACGQQSEPARTSAEPDVRKAEVAQATASATESGGEQKYLTNCAICHQANGNGLPGAFPPLAGSDYFADDRMRAVEATIKGLSGPITVNGVEYNAVMPAMNYLSDEDLAAILSYVLTSWGNSAGAITAEDVAKVRGAAGLGG